MNARLAPLAVPVAVGAATALALGIYGSVHDPTGRDFAVVGFTDVEAWKSGLASVTVLMFITQMSLGFRMTGRYGPRRPAPFWMPDVHRIVGTVAFGLSLPVAFHCLWALGYRTDDARVLVHSLLGCVAYGTYAAKVVAVRRSVGPDWVLPVLGSLLGLTLMAIWWGTALLHYTDTATIGP